MKALSPSRVFKLSTPLCLALLFPHQALAIVGASVHPSDAVDSLDTQTAAGYININPDLDAVVSNEGYSHTTHVEVDQSTGLIRGYSGYDFDTGGSISRTGNLISSIVGTGEPALVANSSGSIIYDATVVGPAGGGPASATFFIDVEGSFNYETGAPALGLLGAVSLNVAPGGNLFAAQNYIVGGQYHNFDDDNLIPQAGSIFTREDFQVLDSFGNTVAEPDLTGIFPEVEFISSDEDDLSLRVSLTVSVQDGDRLIFGGTAAGSATHAFLEDFRDIGVGEEGDVAAASGFVDFLNTANLGIELPEGYSFEGAGAPPLSIISTPSEVPLPASAWLFLTGLLGLASVKRRVNRPVSR